MAIVKDVKRNLVESVTLTLDRNELKLLCTVLNRVGGNPDTSPRKYAAQIVEALEKQAIYMMEHEFAGAVDPKNRAIYFQDDTI